jgi:Ca-activated chloride channel family protein
MRRVPVVLGALLVAAQCAYSQPVSSSRGGDRAASRPSFSSGVDLVPLDVCVRNRNGQPTAGLAADEFLVLENGVPQQISFFSAEGPVRLAVSLLVDGSQSMAGVRLDRAKAAAAGFIARLRPDDLVEVMSFNERANVRYALGSDQDRAIASLDDIRATGMTGLYEAVLTASRRLTNVLTDPARGHRGVLIVLSDGEDTSSLPTFDQVLDDVRRSHLLVYTISLATGGRSSAPGWQLTRLARDTGGRSAAVRDLSELEPLYQDIGVELLHLYRIAYMPLSRIRDGRWRSISVRVPGRDVVVRARSGYYSTRHSVMRQPSN